MKVVFFITKSCGRFQSSRDHKSMSAESAIEKLHKIAKEKKTQRSEHIWRQEEEVELLKRTKTKGELRRAECEVVLNI